ncbi:MAG: hypothetical protein GY835_22500 [bacterium]|nr:hypothetical protein [bacterium]
MTAVAENRTDVVKDGVTAHYPMIAADEIFVGELVMIGKNGAGAGIEGHVSPLIGASIATFEFLGVSEENQDNSGGAYGDLDCKVGINGRTVRMVTSGADDSWHGQTFFAEDGQTGTIVASTTKIAVGKVAYVENATTVWVKLYSASESADLTIDGTDAVTGSIFFDLADDLAQAFHFKESTNYYMTFITTNSSEAIEFGFGRTRWKDDVYASWGDANDISMWWDGTNFRIKPLVDDTGAIIIGDGTTDMDVQIYLGSATEYVDFNMGDSKVVSTVPIDIGNGTGGAMTAFVLGSGISGNTTTHDTSGNFMEFRFENTDAASATEARGCYLRLYNTGDGTTIPDGGSDAMRIFNTLGGAGAGGHHGAHISLNYSGANAATSGLACASRHTFHLPDRAVSVGTSAAVMGEVYLDGTSAVPTGVTACFYACVSGGDATSRQAIVNVMNIAGEVANKAGADMVCNADVTGGGAAATGGFQIRVNGVQKWVATYDI